MFIRRGPLRHARMLVAASSIPVEPVQPEPDQPLVVELVDRDPEAGPLGGPDLAAGSPQPDAVRDGPQSL